MKKIIISIITFLLIFFIYNGFNNKKINYVSIGDNLINGYNKYVLKYLDNSNRLGNANTFINNSIKGLYSDIKKNKTIRSNDNDYFIKKVLRESDILVISIGMQELFNNYDKYDMNHNYKILNKIYNDLDILLNEIRKYAKGTIIFLGYYNPTNYYDSKTDEFFFNIDIKLNKLMGDDIIYIDLYKLVKGHQYKNKDSIYLNEDAYKKISNIIEFYID